MDGGILLYAVNISGLQIIVISHLSTGGKWMGESYCHGECQWRNNSCHERTMLEAFYGELDIQEWSQTLDCIVQFQPINANMQNPIVVDIRQVRFHQPKPKRSDILPTCRLSSLSNRRSRKCASLPVTLRKGQDFCSQRVISP